MLTIRNVFIIFICVPMIFHKSVAQDHIVYGSQLERDVFNSVFFGKLEDTVGFMLASNHEINYALRDEFKKELSEFILPYKLKLTERSNKKLLLKRLSRKIGDKYLKRYQKLSSVYQTISVGQYDCLTSTVLYAYFLEKLQMDYSIWETNYHIYIVVHLNEADLLIEPTDPNFGVVSNKKAIAKRIEIYRQGNEKKVETFLSSFRIEQEVDFLQLVGLQYYNKAVMYFNNQKYNAAINSLNKSLIFYDCDRNRSFIKYSKEYALSETSIK